MSDASMRIELQVWRQQGPDAEGGFERHVMEDVTPDMSFLEMLDLLNERLIEQGDEPIAFDHDCREGICGACGVMIGGVAHGPKRLTTACQLHMREYEDGAVIHVEPWRAKAFPIIKDLSVDRGAFDRIIEAGGYVSVRTGSAPEANAVPISKPDADAAFDAAACIGCGACVAACPNASATLFVAAKLGHLNSLPQGQAERKRRSLHMVRQHEAEGFGACTNHGECEAVCPKGISLRWIARLNREVIKL